MRLRERSRRRNVQRMAYRKQSSGSLMTPSSTECPLRKVAVPARLQPQGPKPLPLNPAADRSMANSPLATAQAPSPSTTKRPNRQAQVRNRALVRANQPGSCPHRKRKLKWRPRGVSASLRQIAIPTAKSSMRVNDEHRIVIVIARPRRSTHQKKSGSCSAAASPSQSMSRPDEYPHADRSSATSRATCRIQVQIWKFPQSSSRERKLAQHESHAKRMHGPRQRNADTPKRNVSD